MSNTPLIYFVGFNYMGSDTGGFLKHRPLGGTGPTPATRKNEKGVISGEGSLSMAGEASCTHRHVTYLPAEKRAKVRILTVRVIVSPNGE
jgi:hypothetical protein